MSIPQRRYVNITSGVGGGASVRLRDLITRVFTTNPLAPPGVAVEFSSAAAVGDYFGTLTDEYYRALFYFGFVSKLTSRPQKLSFARWAKTATVPTITGNKAIKNLSALAAVTSGLLAMDLGSGTFMTSGISLAGSASLSAVATTLQAAIRSVTAGGPAWTAATVTYEAPTNRFVVMSGQSAGPGLAKVESVGFGTDLAPLLGLRAADGAIHANGSAAMTIGGALAQSAEGSNNFASFCFIPPLTTDEVVEAALWNDTQNNSFMFTHRVTAADASTLSAALMGVSGVGLTLAPVMTEYPEMLPGMVLASTDYGRRNSSQNYMFQMGALTPSVTTEADANLYDNLRINYYGRTQAAGQLIDFYQRGVLMGLPTDAVDMNVYGNEIWLKDAAGAELLRLLLSLGRVSANATGRAQVIAALSTVATLGLRNGVISAGKTLTNTQRLYITEITGQELAWVQVQNLGYWLDVVMEPFTTQDGRTEYKAVYTLVYSKDDAIRMVDGTHTLI